MASGLMKTFKGKILSGIFICAILLLNLLTSRGGEPGSWLQNNKTLKILTIGNSFANNACTFLPQIAESVPGCRIEITKANIGGCSLEKHASLIKECENDPTLKPYSEKYCLKELLQMDNYDFVTIQQDSKSSFRSESFQPYADILIMFIKKYSPHSTITIHQTWAYNPNCKRLKDWGIARKEMHSRLVKNYNTRLRNITCASYRLAKHFTTLIKKTRK